MKRRIVLGLFIILLTLVGCNNFFHDLIPPDGNRILSFSVGERQVEPEDIYEYEILVIVDNTGPITSLTPDISISHKASILPVTEEYLSIAFPNVNIMDEIINASRAANITNYVIDLIERNPDFNIPLISMPIDFTDPVDFIVISGQGNVRQYTVHVEIDNGLPRLYNFGFAKLDNRELITDAPGTITEDLFIITEIFYPAEIDVSYSLIPSFRALGDVYIDGRLMTSRVDAIQFLRINTIQEIPVEIHRNGLEVEYTLIAEIAEDPVGVRTIIDFRFERFINPGIVANAVGEIRDFGDTGTIDVNVWYTGAKPSTLRPSFLSSADVYVDDELQESGAHPHDFDSGHPVYVAVSKDGKMQRSYTVRVTFFDASSFMPAMSSFEFTVADNSGRISTDSEAIINDSTGLITINAYYNTIRPTEKLIPTFTALGGGAVMVSDLPQTPGISEQDFSYQIRYTVVSPNPALPGVTKDYWVRVTFVRDTSSDATITYFSFHPEDHAAGVLQEELVGRIDQSAGTINIYAPVGSGVTARDMIARFTTAGAAEVNDIPQMSGTTPNRFNPSVTYIVTSGNGRYTKTYIVTVHEIRSTIYVDVNAAGEIEDEDGASWENAYRTLQQAITYARGIPGGDSIPKEIWIAKGTYTPGAAANSYFWIANNTSYIGGFAGNETSKSARNITANETIISGDLGNDIRANNLFYTTTNINGTIVFDGLTITGARGLGTYSFNSYGAGIHARLNTATELIVNNCTFNDLHATYGGAIYSTGGIVTVTNSKITNVTNNFTGTDNISSGSIYFSGQRNLLIDNVTIDTVEGKSGIYINSSENSIAEIFNSHITNCRSLWGGGIFINNRRTKTLIYNTTIENTRANYGAGIYYQGGNRSWNETTQVFDDWRGVLEINKTTIKNVRAEGSHGWGGGVYAGSHSRLVVTDSLFENCIANENGSAIYFPNSTDPLITGTDFINCTARGRFKILHQSDSAIIRDSRFIHDNRLLRVGSRTPSQMFETEGTFENCIFDNLTFDTSSAAYIFDMYYSYGNLNIDTLSGGGRLMLKDCTFIINDRNTGISRTYTGQRKGSTLFGAISWGFIDATHITYDGCTFTDNTLNSTIGLMYNRTPNDPASSVQRRNLSFRANNYYNGVLIARERDLSMFFRPIPPPPSNPGPGYSPNYQYLVRGPTTWLD